MIFEVTVFMRCLLRWPVRVCQAVWEATCATWNPYSLASKLHRRRRRLQAGRMEARGRWGLMVRTLGFRENGSRTYKGRVEDAPGWVIDYLREERGFDPEGIVEVKQRIIFPCKGGKEKGA